MVSSQTGSSGALVLDANITIALAGKESGRDLAVLAELRNYATLGYQWFAPGVIIAETLYILCGKMQRGELSAADYAAAVVAFEVTMTSVNPPPNGDRVLIPRAVEIGAQYGCSRSADGIYIALAEELSRTATTVLLTFDQGIVNQAATNSPAVRIHVLPA